MEIGKKYNVYIADEDASAQFTATLVAIDGSTYKFDNGVILYGLGYEGGFTEIK